MESSSPTLVGALGIEPGHPHCWQFSSPRPCRIKDGVVQKYPH